MIPYSLKYYDEVETDVQIAKQWYKEQQLGLEIEFAHAIAKTIENIVNTPKLYAKRYKNIRFAHPKKFPFNIHFYIDESQRTVVIIGIIHSKRHPSIYKKRK